MYQPFDTLTGMEEISASALSMAVVATIIYLWLRSVAHRRGTQALRRAQSHSFWCALIAFFLSTSWDLAQFWSVPAQSQSMLTLVFIALNAGGWLALVYIIGLFTWPKELQTVRVASLEPRSLTTPFPRMLGALVGILAIAASCLIWPVSKVAAYVSESDREGVPAQDYSNFSEVRWDGLDRWRPGTEVAPLFALCIAGVLLATALIALIILKRRPLAGISADHNKQLRAVWLNRLLRNCGWVLINIIGSEISYANPILGTGWNTVSTFGFIALGFVLFVWAPKFAVSNVGRNAKASAFSRMRGHSNAVSYVLNSLMVLAAYAIWIACSYRFEHLSEAFGPARAQAASNTLMLALSGAAVAIYLVLSAGFAFYAHLRAKLGTPREPISENLPVWVYSLAALFIVSGIFMLYTPQTLTPGAELAVSPWVSTGIVLGLLLIAAGYIWWTRHCSVPWQVTGEQEIWYRQVLEFRALRILCSALFLLPGVASFDEPMVIAIGVGLFCIPSLLVVKRPNARLLTNVSA